MKGHNINIVNVQQNFKMNFEVQWVESTIPSNRMPYEKYLQLEQF